jgi:hypothetical protein
MQYELVKISKNKKAYASEKELLPSMVLKNKKKLQWHFSLWAVHIWLDRIPCTDG